MLRISRALSVVSVPTTSQNIIQPIRVGYAPTRATSIMTTFQTTTIFRHVRPPPASAFDEQDHPNRYQTLMLYEEIEQKQPTEDDNKIQVILTKYIEGECGWAGVPCAHM